MRELDLKDRAVWEMARRNHVPRELWSWEPPATSYVFGGVVCLTCHREWPCPTSKAVDSFSLRHVDA